MSHSKLRLVLLAAAAVTIINVNAAELVLSPKAKGAEAKTVSTAATSPEFLARNLQLAASPKVLANFPQLARDREMQPDKPKVVCACCK